MTPSESGPLNGSFLRLAVSLICAAPSMTACAWRTISAPIGVTLTSLVPRSKMRTSSSSSSFLIETDSVGCETKHASAARPKCFSRATATTYLSSVSVIRRGSRRGLVAERLHVVDQLLAHRCVQVDALGRDRRLEPLLVERLEFAALHHRRERVVDQLLERRVVLPDHDRVRLDLDRLADHRQFGRVLRARAQ